MCGICLILGGLPIESHQFNFNFFSSYLCKSTIALNQHIINNKLTLSQTINPIQISKQLAKRGPDSLAAHAIDLYKTNYKLASLKEYRKEYLVQKGQAIGMQSILHLRGQNLYSPQTPGSYFLFNGEIWDTGTLSGFDKHENDAKWFHEALMQCKGNRQNMLEILREIRGDYAFVLLEGDQLFMGKDYFGKRSLLLGMGLDYLSISSIPIEQCQKVPEEKDKQEQQEENQTNWNTKYESEWLASKNKNFFEVPANSLISIQMRNQVSIWSFNKIHEIDLKTIPKGIPSSEENIIGCVKKILIESVKELTRSIIDLGGKERQSKVAVLFSGGIDSTLIARMLDLVLPETEEIDLVNLAFRQDAPDRQSGKNSYQELRMLNPNRKFNLILMDHNLNDVQAIEKDMMQNIYPKTTHMDFNIATALYLASNINPRIIMTGLGADQIFGGYSRYRIAYKRAGYDELDNEMIFDMERLWIRNLGRDDRAIGSRAKEVRYPFLYLPLWNYLRTIELSKITEGTGEKQLLRKVARDFGLQKASTIKKRAIQFGTRLAKLSNVKCFGSNRKAKGNSQYQ